MVFKISKVTLFFPSFFLLLPILLLARTHHYSYFSDRPEIFLKAIQSYKDSLPVRCKQHDGYVRAGILPHHFLAHWMMIDFFECLASQTDLDRIILIGPDHFRKGIDRISVSSLPWKTPFGELIADKHVVSKIKETLGLKDDIESFSGEHSIGIIVPLIRYYFPKSKIVPVLVQRQIPMHTLLRFKQLLFHFLKDQKTLILLSMDFSHYQNSKEADRRDEISKNVILYLNYERINELDVDCHTGLFLLMTVLSELGNMKVCFRHHTNSSKITGLKGLKSVTSYYTILFFQYDPSCTKCQARKK